MVMTGDLDDAWAAYKAGDYQKAIRLWRPLAEQGNVRAQNNLAHAHAKGLGVSQDWKAAAKWWAFAAEQGYARSQTSLGWVYHKGLGVPQDQKLAMKWTRLAAA